MASFLFQVLSFSSLLVLGIYHLVSTTRNFLKFPRDYIARPFHPLPLTSRLRLLPLYLTAVTLLLAFLHQSILSGYADPLTLGHTPVHRFTSLQSAAVIFLFLLLTLLVFFSESHLSLPPDLIFGLAAAFFYLHSSSASAHADALTPGLEAKCDSISARISALSSLLCLVLAFNPRLFVADVGLGASLCLQGFWALQTGLSLCIEAFIPDGCHKLLDVVGGIEGSTKCELDESKLRAIAVLDLAFVIHVMFVMILVFLVYVLVSKAVGVSRRFGAYEPLATTADASQVQLKTISGTQA